jgi:hypothetical protein
VALQGLGLDMSGKVAMMRRGQSPGASEGKSWLTWDIVARKKVLGIFLSALVTILKGVA